MLFLILPKRQFEHPIFPYQTGSKVNFPKSADDSDARRIVKSTVLKKKETKLYLVEGPTRTLLHPGGSLFGNKVRHRLQSFLAESGTYRGTQAV